MAEEDWKMLLPLHLRGIAARMEAEVGAEDFARIAKAKMGKREDEGAPSKAADRLAFSAAAARLLLASPKMQTKEAVRKVLAPYGAGDRIGSRQRESVISVIARKLPKDEAGRRRVVAEDDMRRIGEQIARAQKISAAMLAKIDAELAPYGAAVARIQKGLPAGPN